MPYIHMQNKKHVMSALNFDDIIKLLHEYVEDNWLKVLK